MDNLTHSLVGLAAAKAGLEKLSPRTTALCILAANAPDSDILVLIFGGRWSFLKHHRGFSHSIVGTISLAVSIPILFYLADLVVSRLRNRSLKVNFRGLLIASIIVSATHPILDWTNNYGIRFLLPWSARWFYGDLVYIVDPFLWALFGGACFLLTSGTMPRMIAWSLLGLMVTLLVLFSSTQRSGLSNPLVIPIFWMTALACILVLLWLKAGKRWGAKTAMAAFVLLLVYWGGLFYAHHRALMEARQQASILAARNGETVLRLAAMPTLGNPLSWLCVFDTDKGTYRFDLSLMERGSALPTFVRYEKPTQEELLLVQKASEDQRVKIFLGFARFPVIELGDTDCTTQTLVQFADLRYTEPGNGRGTFSLDVPVACPFEGSSK